MQISIEEGLKLSEWYKENKRELPWRDTGNPYDVWISEIMLQQTRIEAVIPKYNLFKKELPDIASLAECSDDHLMRLWEGLGYYSRARNLKKCAQVLLSSYNGKLPSDYKELLKLPGIGPYTAGAIASIAYGKPVKAVDGNVLRVLARVFAIKDDVRDKNTTDKISNTLNDIYEAVLPPSFYRNFNQGLMELGETVCLPSGAPACHNCPWKGICICAKTSAWATIPYRSPLKKRDIVDRTILVIKYQNAFLLHKRPNTGLLAGLYEFAGVDRHLSADEVKDVIEKMGYQIIRINPLPDAKHIFTHLEWHMHAYEIEVKQPFIPEDSTYIWADRRKLQRLALPSAFKKYVMLYKLR